MLRALGIGWGLWFAPACHGTEEDTAPPPFTANVDVATVTERALVDGRQQVRIVEGSLDFRASLPAAPEVAIGDRLWLGKGPLRGDLVWIDDVAVATEAQIASFDRLDPPEGGLRVEDVFREREALAGASVRVRGRVVKASPNIFGTHWYHLRDGSGQDSDGTHDLTVTSDDHAEVGDVVVIDGPLTVDKDLGFGYRYDAIVEGAQVSIE